MDRQSIITACLSVFPYSMNFCFYLAINFLPSLIYISPGTVCSTFIPLMLYMQDFVSLLGTITFSIPVAVSAPPFRFHKSFQPSACWYSGKAEVGTRTSKSIICEFEKCGDAGGIIDKDITLFKLLSEKFGELPI